MLDTKKQLEAHLVGQLNFFGMAAHGGGGHQKEGKKSERFVSFDITEVATRLEAQGLMKEENTLTIIPVGTPNAKAQPLIGEFVLVQQ